RADRMRTNSFGETQLYLGPTRTFTRIPFDLPAERARGNTDLRRTVDAHPFVPRGEAQLRERCEDIFKTQGAGLAKRLEHIGLPACAIGISGGLDSTLALLVACKTFDALGAPRSKIQGITMPGFGTTNRTRDNARAIMQHLGITAREIDIRAQCLEQMKA